MRIGSERCVEKTMPDLVMPGTLTDKMIREYRESVVRDPKRSSAEIDRIVRDCEYAALEHLAPYLSPGVVAECRQRICDAINACSKEPMVIYKYTVSPGEFTAAMPDGSRVVAVQVQHGEPQMWAIVDPARPTTARRFRAVATGEHFEPSWHYIGTFQLEHGSLVFHLLEERP